jgi:hypothetical protein
VAEFSKCRSSKAVFVLAIYVLLLVGISAAQATPPVTCGEQIPVPGRPIPAGYGQLAEHNRDWVVAQTPQIQAEFLLGAAINHDRGAAELINKMVDDWMASCTSPTKLMICR